MSLAGQMLNELPADENLQNKTAVVGFDCGLEPIDQSKELGRDGWQCARIGYTYTNEELQCAARMLGTLFRKLNVHNLPCIIVLMGGEASAKAGVVSRLHGFLAEFKAQSS